MNNVHKVREEFNGCQTARGLTIKPRAGNAAIFYNLLPNTKRTDFSTWHASCDVVGSGRKFAANLWFNLHFAAQLRMSAHARPQMGDPSTFGS